MSNDFDIVSRFAIKAIEPIEVLDWLLPAVQKTWKWTGWLDTRTIAFPGEPDRTCDTVAILERITGDAFPVATVIEVQFEPESIMPARLAEYGLRIHRESPFHRDPLVRYDVVGIVMNLTGPVQSSLWQIQPPDFGNLSLSLNYRSISLREEDAIQTLHKINLGMLGKAILPWIPLMKFADQQDVLDEWKRIAWTEVDERKRANYGAIALVFSEAAKRNEIWSKSLEGWNMVRSKVTMEWEKQGESRGEIRGKQDSLKRFLGSRFSTSLSPTLIQKIETTEDLKTIDQWINCAGLASSLYDFQAMIQR